MIRSFAVTYFFPDGSPYRLINEVFFVRIPVFLIGIVIGAEIKGNKKTNNISNIWVSVAGILLIVLWLLNAAADFNYSRWIGRVIFMPTTVCIAIVFADCLEKGSKKIRNVFVFMGSITLEIYLVHEKILAVYDTYITKCTIGSILSNFAAAVIAILLSTGLSIIVDALKYMFPGRDELC